MLSSTLSRFVLAFSDMPLFALRDAFSLRLEVFVSETFDATDHAGAFFRRDQQAHCCGDASRVVTVQLRVGDLHL